MIFNIIYNLEIARDTYMLCLDGRVDYTPGQFAHIKIPHSAELILRRPISINYIDQTIDFVYRIEGEGTRRLSTATGKLDVLLPLGNGFDVKDYKKIWLVGGGIGIAPLKSVLFTYDSIEFTSFLGYRSAEYIYQLEDFKNRSEVCLCTDDGSAGHHGLVTELIEQRLKSDTPDAIFACGPTPMFKAMKHYDIPIYASLEQRMGCGVGGCSVCTCSVAGHSKRVCYDGPVFPLKEVDFDV